MKKILITLTIFINLITSAFANTQDRSSDVEKFISDLGNNIIQISQEEHISPIAKSDKIIKTIDKAIDSKWISRFVLGIHYKRSSEEQISKFRDLYNDFLINTYGPKFQNYRGNGFEVKEVIKQKRFYLVKTNFITKKTDPAIAIDFRVKDYKGQLTVLDFIAEGISLIETQRSEFNSAISKNGMDKFLDDLEERVARLKN